MNWNLTTLGAWTTAIVAIGGALAGFVKFLFWVWDEIQKRRNRDGFSAPLKTLHLAPGAEGACWWGMGKVGDTPSMQIVGEAQATNITCIPARVLQVELRSGFWGRKRLSGIVMVSSGGRREIYGQYDIPPSETRNVSFSFWLYPPVDKRAKAFVAHSVVFIDQFGNRHKMRSVSFRPLSSVMSGKSKEKEPEEFPYKITDPIEKEVVSVLKAEISRYEICGRRVGGLGSVHIVYKNQPLIGLGSDSWRPDSPTNQFIVPDPEAASITSDNLEALILFYKSLKDEKAHGRFVTVLLERLDEKRGYLAVSYFIVCVLWRVGCFPEALQKARRDLPVGETRVFGLSNVLMLLNGLLKYLHPQFTNQMLDEIERMTHGLDEHPFRIHEKIAAIRAERLAKPVTPNTP